jgi:plasmid stabilization system protein ParE
VALRYAIKARARREIERAAQCWSENRLDAPGAVRIELESVLVLLSHHPGLGRKVDTRRPIQVRRYLLRNTQHWLYYMIAGDLLEVLSVWGTGRGSGPKL